MKTRKKPASQKARGQPKAKGQKARNQMSKGPRCPACRSSSAVYRGFRHNAKSKKQLMLCRKCGRKFTPDDGFLRMRFRKEDIMEAVYLYSKDFSLAEVQKRMERKGIKVSRWTVLLWVRKYGKRRISI